MENNFLNTAKITLKGSIILWKEIFLSETCFEKSIQCNDCKDCRVDFAPNFRLRPHYAGEL